MRVVRPIRPSIYNADALANRPLTGDTRVPYRVGNTLYVWDDSAQIYVALGGGGGMVQANYLTLGLDPGLTNERNFTVGANLIGTDGGANGNYTLVGQQGAFAPNAITVTPSARQDDYNPAGWNGTYPNNATTIFLNPTTHFVMGGLQGGAQGRVVNLVNVSTKLVILEHLGAGSSAANRFSFAQDMAHFLLPGRSVTLIYNTLLNLWVGQSKDSGLDAFEDFYQEGSPTSQMGYAYWHTQNSGSVNGGATGVLRALGSIILSSGTSSVIGNAKVSMIQRSAIIETSSYPDYYLSLCRVALENIPTALSDYNAAFGMGQNGISSWSASAIGAYWAIDRAYNATNFYCAAGNPITKSPSGLAFQTGWINFGVFNENFTEACFFYSTDNGRTYVIDQVITTILQTSTPISLAGIWSINAAATAKRMSVDYLAASFKNPR